MRNQIEQIKEWQSSRKLDKMPYNHENESINILEEVFESDGYNSEFARDFANEVTAEYKLYGLDSTPEQHIDAYFDICVYVIGAMMKLGFDPVKVFDEGLREINDRTGEYDEIVGKWVKNKTKANPYKADYSKARL